MDPITISALIASILGTGMQAIGQNDQKQLGYANLAETKRENRSREQLAESSQTDAYGNRVYYDPLLKQWKIDTTPTTKSILDAEQGEQLKSLTTDASRNRNAANRKDSRSRLAADEFTKEFNDFKYRPQRSEADYVGDATREALLARRESDAKTAAAINTSLIRQGNGANIGATFNAARDADANDFERVLLGAKRQGEQDYLGTEGSKDQEAQQRLDFLRGISDDTDNSQPMFGNENATLSGTANNSIANLIQTLGSNSANRQGAEQSLMSVVGQTPDFSQIIAALGGIAKQQAPTKAAQNLTGFVPYVGDAARFSKVFNDF